MKSERFLLIHRISLSREYQVPLWHYKVDGPYAHGDKSASNASHFRLTVTRLRLSHLSLSFLCVSLTLLDNIVFWLFLD